MFNLFRRPSWSPYLVGFGIGVLTWFAFATANQPVGVSTAFENTALMTQQAAAPEAAENNPLLAAKVAEGKRPRINWEWMLVLGVFIGALVSSGLSGDRERTRVPALWGWRFGQGAGVRYAGAFVGGALLMFGARLAGGCTSGHGISGTLQLAVSSWVFILVAFAAGSLAAFMLYGREGRNHV